jgi:hypothetical protein
MVERRFGVVRSENGTLRRLDDLGRPGDLARSA